MSHIGWSGTVRGQQPAEGPGLVERSTHKRQGLGKRLGQDRGPGPANRNHHPPESPATAATSRGRKVQSSGADTGEKSHATAGVDEVGVGFEANPDYPAYEHFRQSVDRLRQQIVHGTVASVRYIQP